MQAKETLLKLEKIPLCELTLEPRTYLYDRPASLYDETITEPPLAALAANETSLRESGSRKPFVYSIKREEGQLFLFVYSIKREGKLFVDSIILYECHAIYDFLCLNSLMH